jgi:hypothetical protein
MSFSRTASLRADFDFVRHPALRQILAHWLSLLDEGRPADRRALDPSCMADALPFVWLCEKQGAGRFRVRLAGAEINELLQRPLRGRYLDEVLDEADRAEIEQKFSDVLGIPAVVWTEGPIVEGATGECLMMPMHDRGRLGVVLGGTVHGLEHVFRPGHLIAIPPKQMRIVALGDL